MQLKGFVSAVSALLWCWSLVSASTVTFLGPTGIRNRNNICYMNALLSSLYDVTPFRKVPSQPRYRFPTNLPLCRLFMIITTNQI